MSAPALEDFVTDFADALHAGNPWDVLGNKLDGRYSHRQWIEYNIGHVWWYLGRRFHFTEREYRYRELYEGNPAKLRALVMDARRDNREKYEQWIRYIGESESKLIIVVGKRGGGKTWTTGCVLYDVWRRYKRPICALTLGQNLPYKDVTKSDGTVERVHYMRRIVDLSEAPNGSIVLVDESARTFNSRASMTKRGRGLPEFLSTARHKGLTVLFVTQNTGMTDFSATRLADAIWVKPVSLNQTSTERNNAQAMLSNFDEMNPRRAEENMILADDLAPMTFYRPRSPFWRKEFSQSFGGTYDEPTALDIGLRLAAAGRSYDEIAIEMSSVGFRQHPVWWMARLVAVSGGIDPVTGLAVAEEDLAPKPPPTMTRRFDESLPAPSTRLPKRGKA